MNINDKEAVSVSLLTLGEANVGKTSISTRFIKDSFSSTYLSTIGVDFFTKDYILPSCTLKVTVWDTAGQEKLRCLTTNFLRKAEGAIICYDITEQGSFEKITFWINDIKDKGLKFPIVIAGNKIDCQEEAFENEKKEAEDFAKKENYNLFRCSARTGENIDRTFFTLIKLAMEKKGYDSRELCEWLREEKSIDIGESAKLKDKAKRDKSKQKQNIKIERDSFLSSEEQCKNKKCCKE